MDCTTKAWRQRSPEKCNQGRQSNLTFLLLQWKNIYPFGKKIIIFKEHFWVLKNYSPHAGNVRKHELQSEILTFLSCLRYEVCVFSICLFEVVLDLREVVLFMQAEQVWAAFLGQLYFMQWSRQFLAELNHTYVTSCCPWITLEKML